MLNAFIIFFGSLLILAAIAPIFYYVFIDSMILDVWISEIRRKIRNLKK